MTHTDYYDNNLKLCYDLDAQASSLVNTNVYENIHAGLIIWKSLIEKKLSFLLPRYDEICNKLLMFKMHKNYIITKTLIELAPTLAELRPESFVKYINDLYIYKSNIFHLYIIYYIVY